MTQHNNTRGQKPITGADAALRAIATVEGEKFAAEVAAENERLEAARFQTETRRSEASAIAQAVRASGTAPQGEPVPDFLAEDDEAKRKRQLESQRAMRSPSKARAKQAMRVVKKMASRMHSRLKGRLDAERQAATGMAEKAFKRHGIRHHFRSIPKTAWFAGHMASYDRDGLLMLEAFASCGLPAWRMALTLSAARNPQGYEVRRHVRTGKREHQSPHVYDGRAFGGGTARRSDWKDGQRLPSHPGFQRVLACAIFLWMAKSTSRKPGALHVVHGFGRGVFASMLRCHYSAIFDHDDGMPGAMLSLRAVGFVHFHQPPADEVSEIDHGPNGHAYNKYWLPKHPREDLMAAALVDARELLNEMGREALPAHWRRSVLDELTLVEPEPPDIVSTRLPH